MSEGQNASVGAQGTGEQSPITYATLRGANAGEKGLRGPTEELEEGRWVELLRRDGRRSRECVGKRITSWSDSGQSLHLVDRSHGRRSIACGEDPIFVRLGQGTYGVVVPPGIEAAARAPIEVRRQDGEAVARVLAERMEDETLIVPQGWTVWSLLPEGRPDQEG